MKRMTFGTQIMAYVVLLGGALLFSAPLLWMLSTALKPIEQTMSLPPAWLPYRYDALLDGEWVPVKLAGRLDAAEASGETGGESDDSAAMSPQSVRFKVESVADSGRTAVVPASRVRRRICFRWHNFRDAVKAMRYFPRYLRNTLVLCFLTVLGTVFSSAFAAYGFSRIEWKGRDRVFLLAMATMMIPFPVVMVPLYCLFRALGMIGTLQPLWIGSFLAGAFNVFLLRQFFMGIPKALSDAARIDGCNELMIFWKIVLPMSKAPLMVVALFQFMGTWNDFLGPLLYLTDQKDYTLALGLQFFQSQSGGTEWNYLMAASALVVIPVMLLFFFTQKSFIAGISTGAVKG